MAPAHFYFPKSKLAVAQAQVASAQAALTLAQANLAEQALKAPFDGTVAALRLKAGEFVAPGAPVAQLANLSSWQFEADNLTERGVVNIHVGAPVKLAFDAIPGLELAGKVTRVDAYGADSHGDITYTVVIEPTQPDARLRWNMTATATISTGSS